MFRFFSFKLQQKYKINTKNLCFENVSIIFTSNSWPETTSDVKDLCTPSTRKNEHIYKKAHLFVKPILSLFHSESKILIKSI